MLCLKMAHITLKVLDDCMRMHTHGFSFQERNSVLNLEFKKGIIKGHNT